MGRTTIVKDLLQIYQQYPELCFQEIRVVFRGESGVDMGGLTRELFSVFWTAIYLAGNVEKVPVLTPKVLSDFLYLGRSYLMVLYLVGGYFPLCFSRVCAAILISGSHSVSDDILLSSFFNFVDHIESNALTSCLSGSFSPHEMNEVIIPMLSRFNTSIIPSESNIKR